MSYPVRYRCPACGAIAELERRGYLADRSVTPYPLAGWTYGSTDDLDDPAIDGVRLVCAADGCGDPFYLSFERYENGERVEVRPPAECVELGVGPSSPRGPSP